MTALLAALLLLWSGGDAGAVDGAVARDPRGPDAGVPDAPRETSLAGEAILRVHTDEKLVALTFDACATPSQPNTFDQTVWDEIRAAGVPVTVFLSGRWIQAHPDAARALASSPLVELGNHTTNHPALAQLSEQQIAREIDDTEALIAGLGRRSVALRPPFGEWDVRTAKVAAARGLPLVLWDVVSADAGGHVRPERMIAEVTERARPGSIVIFHINGRGPHTKDALPPILANLHARGYTFVHISSLLAHADARATGHPQHYVTATRRLEPLGGGTKPRPELRPAHDTAGH